MKLVGCTEPFQSPLIHTLCNNLFCSNCISEWINTHNTTCVLCRQIITDDNLVSAPHCITELCNELLVRCEHNDCNTILQRQQYTSHVQVNHNDSIQCNTCHNNIHKSLIDEHNDIYCGQVIVPCPIAAEFGCTWSGERKSIELHRTQCQYKSAVQHIDKLKLLVDKCHLEQASLKFELGRMQYNNKQLQRTIDRQLLLNAHNIILRNNTDNNNSSNIINNSYLSGHTAINRSSSAVLTSAVPSTSTSRALQLNVITLDSNIPKPKIVELIDKFKLWRKHSHNHTRDSGNTVQHNGVSSPGAANVFINDISSSPPPPTHV